jgi:hypothetical protein
MSHRGGSHIYLAIEAHRWMYRVASDKITGLSELESQQKEVQK